MRGSTTAPPATFDLLSELAAPSANVPPPPPAQSSGDVFSQIDLMSLTPPKQAPPSTTSPTDANRSLSGGVAKGGGSKDPFADLFAK